MHRTLVPSRFHPYKPPVFLLPYPLLHMETGASNEISAANKPGLSETIQQWFDQAHGKNRSTETLGMKTSDDDTVVIDGPSARPSVKDLLREGK